MDVNGQVDEVDEGRVPLVLTMGRETMGVNGHVGEGEGVGFRALEEAEDGQVDEVDDGRMPFVLTV